MEMGVSTRLKVAGKNTPRWFIVGATSSAGISASLMFPVVDQPAGTGFSYASTDSYIHDLNAVCSVHPAFRLLLTPLQASDQFIEFLRNFYSVFPEYKTMDVRLLHLLTPPESFLIVTERRPIWRARVSRANTYPISVSLGLYDTRR